MKDILKTLEALKKETSVERCKKRESGKENYILVKSNSPRKNGEKSTGYETAMILLSSGCWPLYKNTPCRNTMKSGDNVLIYISGRGSKSKTVIAKAKIKTVENVKNQLLDTLDIMYENSITHTVRLEKIDIFPEPVTLSTLINKLEFTNIENMKKWGVTLIGGARNISEKDFKLIVKATNI